MVTNEEAASLVSNIIQVSSDETIKKDIRANLATSNIKGEYHHELGNNDRLTLAAQVLRDYAYSKGSTDNISVMVIQVQ